MATLTCPLLGGVDYLFPSMQEGNDTFMFPSPVDFTFLAKPLAFLPMTIVPVFALTVNTTIPSGATVATDQKIQADAV